MTDAVIVAVITAFSTIVVQLIISANSKEQITSKLDTALKVQQTKLEALTAQVAKHNSIIERTYKLESAVAVLDTKLKDLEDDKK